MRINSMNVNKKVSRIIISFYFGKYLRKIAKIANYST